MRRRNNGAALLGPQEKRCRTRAWMDGAESNSSTSSAGSDANEYAEGLGCADRRRCRDPSSSVFEFDNHDREEYFEQPATSRFRFREECGRQVEERPKFARGSALNSVLAKLEAAEQVDSGERDREEWVQRKLEAIRSRACRRSAKKIGKTHGGAPDQAIHIDAEQPTKSFPAARMDVSSVLSDTKEHTEIDSSITCQLTPEKVKDYCLKLGTIRGEMERGNGTTGDESEVSRMLEELTSITVDVALLRTTGIGVELNKVAWQRHENRHINSLSTGLVSKWRKTIRGVKD